MDQQVEHDVLNIGSEGAEPYGLPGLALSLCVILGLTALGSLVVATIVLAAQVLILGVDETRSFYLSLRFDIPMRTKLDALKVATIYGTLACATVLVARFKARSAWRDLIAWRPVGSGWQRNASVGLMVLGYAAVTTFVLARLNERHVPIDGPTDPLLVGLLATNLIVFAPIAEECLFRGWIYTGLRRRLRFGTTLFATAFLFAAIHWDRRHMVLVLPLAFALGFIREQTGSIRPTVALHASYNLVIVLITLWTQ